MNIELSGQDLEQVSDVIAHGDVVRPMLTPIVMLAAFPAVVGMLPGLELTPALALIPIFNVYQIIKEIFLGEFSRVAYAVAFVANLAYAAIGYFVATGIFKSESVLFRV